LLVKDFYFILVAFFLFIITLFNPYMGLSFTLKFQTLGGYFYLWKHPIREPLTPWDSELESKSWWEQDAGDKREIIDPTAHKDTPW